MWETQDNEDCARFYTEYGENLDVSPTIEAGHPEVVILVLQQETCRWFASLPTT